MSKKIITTGGLGFIGAHTVVELIDNGFEPVIFDNLSNSELKVLDNLKTLTGRDIPFYNIDCCKKHQVEEAIVKEGKIGGIIHFAASKSVNESVTRPLKYYSNNINSLMTMLHCMEEFNIPNFVFSSSCTVYGQPDKLPVTEQQSIGQVTSPYGNTKKISEEIIKDFYSVSPNSKLISLRYFNPIGAHSSGLIGELPKGIPSNLVPFITQTAAGLRPVLNVYGDDYNTPDGTCIRDFIHVVDLAKAHVKSIIHLEQQKNKFYDYFNVGTGKGTTVMQLINTFEKVNCIKVNYKIVEKREGDIEKIYADTSKANNVLNWRAQLDLEQALKDAWNWQMNLKLE